MIVMEIVQAIRSKLQFVLIIIIIIIISSSSIRGAIRSHEHLTLVIPSKSSDNDNGVHESTEASGNMTIQGRPTCKMEKKLLPKNL